MDSRAFLRGVFSPNVNPIPWKVGGAPGSKIGTVLALKPADTGARVRNNPIHPILSDCQQTVVLFGLVRIWR